MQCGVKTRSGAPCKNPPVRGRERCRMHGGKQRRGIAHHETKTGRYSKDMPTRLLSTYQTAISDPDMLNLTEEIGLQTSRLSDLLKRVDSGESGALWGDLRTSWEEFTKAQAERDTIAMSQLMREIGDLITRGNADWQTWREISMTIDQRRKLVDTERRRRVDMKTMITSERAGVLILALTDSVRRNVTDSSTLESILGEFGAIIGEDGS